MQLPLEVQQLCGPPATSSLMEFDGIWRDLLAAPIKTLFQCLRNYFLQHEQEINDILNTTTIPPLPNYLSNSSLHLATPYHFHLFRQFNKYPQSITSSFISFQKASTLTLTSTMANLSINNPNTLPKGILKWRQACPTLPQHFETTAWSIFSKSASSSTFSKTTLFPLWLSCAAYCLHPNLVLLSRKRLSPFTIVYVLLAQVPISMPLWCVMTLFMHFGSAPLLNAFGITSINF